MSPVNQKRDEDAMWRIRQNQLLKDERRKRPKIDRREHQDTMFSDNRASCSSMSPAMKFQSVAEGSDDEHSQGEDKVQYMLLIQFLSALVYPN